MVTLQEMVVHCPSKIDVLLAVNEMETGLLVGVRTGVAALVLVARGVRVGAGRRVGVEGGRVAVPGGGVRVAAVGVLVA